MSQIYHIELKSSVTETVDVSDHVIHKLNLTPILDQESMLDILTMVLLDDGFQKSSENSRTLSKKNQRNEEVTFDLDALEIKVVLQETKELQTTVTAKHSYDTDFSQQEEAQVQAQQKLALQEEIARHQLQKQGEAKQRELTNKLNQNLDAQQREFHEIMQQVYAESVKRKARQLGDVMEVNESTVDGQYELVIKIEC